MRQLCANKQMSVGSLKRWTKIGFWRQAWLMELITVALPQKIWTWASFFFFFNFGRWGQRGVVSDGRGKRKTQKGAWLQKCQHLQVVTADCRRVITTLSDSRRSAKSINPIQCSVLAQHHSLQFLIQTDCAQAFIYDKLWRTSECLLKVEKKVLANAVSS